VDELKASGKPFRISKQEVWDAWLKVKGNQGAPGVDGQSIEAFEADLKNNLYRIWNRMSSGTLCLPKILSAQVGVAIWFRRGPDELVARRQSARCSMMDGCAAATGLPGCDERVRVTAASSRERPG
jgi:hypothetical protein